MPLRNGGKFADIRELILLAKNSLRRFIMKMKLLAMIAVMLGIFGICKPVFAHHGAAAYDMSKPVVLKDAVVTQFLWINPHPLIKADYKDEKGTVQHWTMEMGST